MRIREKIRIETMLAEADALETAARQLRSEARERREAAAADRRRRQLANLWKLIVRNIERGMSEPDALASAAQFTGFKPETVAYRWQSDQRRIARLRRWRRDREIFRLAHTHSNAELADRFRISPATVSRVLRRQLANRHQLRE